MTKRQDYSEDIKAQVMAALLTGQSVAEVAAAYNIPAATIRSWKSRQANGDGVATVATQKRELIGELLVNYLQASLQTLTIQVEAFGDKAWLAKQSASEAAVLHGVLTDKTIRLLEALAGDAEDPAPAE